MADLNNTTVIEGEPHHDIGVMVRHPVKEVQAMLVGIAYARSPKDACDKMQHLIDSGIASTEAADEKRERLSPAEDTQSTVTILRNYGSDEERKKKVLLLLDSYHALIDIHSLTDLFVRILRESVTPVAGGGEEKREIGAADDYEGWAVLMKPGCGFEAKAAGIKAVRIAVQVSSFSMLFVCWCHFTYAC